MDKLKDFIRKIQTEKKNTNFKRRGDKTKYNFTNSSIIRMAGI